MNETRAKAGRLYGLDALRGLAVLLMIEQHLGVWLWRGPHRGEGFSSYPIIYIFNALGGGAAPLFVTLAGIGSALMIAKRGSRNEAVDLTLIRRGITLMGFGLLLNLLTPSWFTWRSWFVLHLMGFGMLITPALRRLPTRVLLAVGIAILLATPAMQSLTSTPLDLSNTRMSGILHKSKDRILYLPQAPLRIALTQGQFPIFGWLSFFVFGLMTGRALNEGRWKWSLGAGIGLLASGALAATVGAMVRFSPKSYLHWATRIHIPFFPASPALLAMLLGGVLIAIALVMRPRERPRLHEAHPMVTLGRASLTLLLLHVYLFRELTRPIGLWRSLEAGPALGILTGFTVLAFVLAWLWQRVDYRFGAEWLLRKLAP